MFFHLTLSLKKVNQELKKIFFRGNLTHFYKDYIWKNGKPYGINKIDDVLKDTLFENKSIFKVIADPYYKRISIEEYLNGCFKSIIYDSAIFDFRHLKPAEQNAWQKITVSEEESKCICHIRNHDDRLVLVEEYRFEKDQCRECYSYSPHGILVSHQKIYYTSLGDSFNGTILFDKNNHQVMSKTYKVNDVTNEFSDLLQEQWDMTVKV